MVDGRGGGGGGAAGGGTEMPLGSTDRPMARTPLEMRLPALKQARVTAQQPQPHPHPPQQQQQHQQKAEDQLAGQWNTRNLGLRLGADATSAATAAALIAPVICVIDRSIVTKAAMGTSLLACLSQAIRPAVRQPLHFLASRPFLLIFGLYFSTYSTANAIDTLTSTVSNQPADRVTSNTAKFVATSAVNMAACVYKDSQFARMFGAVAASSSSSPAAAIPKLSYALFAARDCLTIFASFNLPTIIAPRLLQLPAPVQARFKPLLSTEAGRVNTAQFVAPAAMQIFSTPIHLLGLDLYNRQARLGVRERGARIMRDWGVSALARMARIIPAFGVGGVVNGKMRRSLMEGL